MLLLKTYCAIQHRLSGLSVAVAMVSLITSVACGQQHDWKEHANQRIQDLRQRDTQIRVLDKLGKPLSGVAIEVAQTSKAFPFGAALSPTVLRDPKYQEFFLKHFNWAVFENDMKWYSNEGRRGQENYSRADTILTWCNEHDIPVRDHCIFWEPEKWQPRWLQGLDGEEFRLAPDKEALLVPITSSKSATE